MIVELVCPWCSAVLVELDHVPPVVGGVEVCGECLEVLLVASGLDGLLVLRAPSAEELAAAYGLHAGECCSSCRSEIEAGFGREFSDWCCCACPPAAVDRLGVTA